MLFIQFIGIVGSLFLFFSFFFKKREKLLTCQIISYIFFSIHYLMLNAKSGYIISVINLIRSLFITIKEQHKNIKFLQYNYILFVFILTYVVVSLLTYQDVFSLLPGIATIVYTSMIWQGREKELRYGAVINAILWVIYDIHVLSYVGLVSDSSLAIINIIFLIGMCKHDKTKAIVGAK